MRPIARERTMMAFRLNKANYPIAVAMFTYQTRPSEYLAYMPDASLKHFYVVFNIPYKAFERFEPHWYEGPAIRNRIMREEEFNHYFETVSGKPLKTAAQEVRFK